MRRLGRLAANEDGFTLVEAIVVSTLTLVVLAALYNVFATGLSNARMIEQNNRATRDVGKNLDVMSRYVRSSEGLDGPLETGDPEDYALSTKVDVDADGQYEYLTFRLDNTTKELEVTTKQHDGSTHTVLYGENVQNQYLMEPIFTYYGRNGNVITNPAERAAKTTSVRIRLVIDDDLTTAPQAFDADTVVTLRNAQT